MFLRNYWYVAAWSGEVADTPLARTILNEPVVFFRGIDGTIGALEDRCPHRLAPLSKGRCVGNGLQCGYHGLTFDRTGACTHVPGQTAIPPGTSVKTYPVVERWSWVWIWMGVEDQADETKIPDFHLLDAPGWRSKGERLPMQCNYQLVIDNLLDLSHLTFLHQGTIGTAAVADTPVETKRDGDTVQVARWMFDVAPPPTFAKLGQFSGNIDRWQIATAAPPCYVWLEVGGADAGTGVAQDDRSKGVERWNLNVATPETDSTTHLFWAECHSFSTDDPSVTEFLYQQIHDTLLEDVDMLEAQQRLIEKTPNPQMVDLNVDAAGIQARRIVARLLEQEQAGPA